jgi:RNA polymerase sigma factor (TIGR02999 family)
MAPDESPQDPAGDKPAPTEPVAPEQVQGDVTLILSRIEQGELHAAEELLPLVYAELRKLAAAKMAQEKPGQTLQATALVHEAYIRLVDVEKAKHWDSRGHFFAAAAEAMRRILVEGARRKQTLRAGGGAPRVELSHIEPIVDGPALDLVALHEALERLEQEDPRKAQLVKLRFFAGLTIPASAEILGISITTAKADWAYAKGWLCLELGQAD